MGSGSDQNTRIHYSGIKLERPSNRREEERGREKGERGEREREREGERGIERERADYINYGRLNFEP